MIIQLLVVLGALYVGTRFGSLALGAISGISLAILVLGFGMKPGNPPTDVIYIIIAAVTCFDYSGTTVIGKYLLNHSFMMPGLVSVIVSTIVGSIITTIFY